MDTGEMKQIEIDHYILHIFIVLLKLNVKSSQIFIKRGNIGENTRPSEVKFIFYLRVLKVQMYIRGLEMDSKMNI